MPFTLGPLQFDSDLFAVCNSLSDLLPAIFQHFEYRFVSKAMQKDTHNAETYNLRNEMRPIDAKGVRNLLKLPIRVGSHDNNQSIHRVNSRFYLSTIC